MTHKITSTDKLLYTYIRSFTRNDKPVFASNKHLAEVIGKSESVISHSISRLLKNHYLENRGNKYIRQLYTKNDLVNADFDLGNAKNDFSKAKNNQSNAENSISLEEMKRVIAENSNKETLKTAIANAENSYILIKILLSYTDKNNTEENETEKTQSVKNNPIGFEKEFEDLWSDWMPFEMVRGNKKTAKEKFVKVRKSGIAFDAIKKSSEQYCKMCSAKKIKSKHISTWLNQNGWEDEYYVPTAPKHRQDNFEDFMLMKKERNE